MIQDNEVKVFLDEIDFDTFDKVISREIIAEKDTDQEQEDVVDTDVSDVTILDDEIDIPEDFNLGDLDTLDVDTEFNDCTDCATDATDAPEEEEHKSLSQIYESRRVHKRNKLVEALLVDDTVDSIERIIKSTLDAYGITKAEAIVTMGLILDHLMNSSDDDIVAPEYLGNTIGQVVEDKDVAKIITKEVEDALMGKEPEKVEAKVVLPDGVVDMVEETSETKD